MSDQTQSEQDKAEVNVRRAKNGYVVRTCGETFVFERFSKLVEFMVCQLGDNGEPCCELCSGTHKTGDCLK